jgi:hypothetical protein
LVFGAFKLWIEAQARLLAATLVVFFVLGGPVDAAEEASTAPIEIGESPLLTAGPIEYRPGRGLRLGPSGAVIGGFTNIKAEHTKEDGGEFAVDKLNFFLIFDRYTRFRAVAELQLKDIFAADKERAGTRDFAFDVRRLFGDFVLDDELRVRAGTFLTEVGYWNLILAEPLTWTTEAPLIIEETFFQATTTGLMLHGSRGVGVGQIGYSLSSQFLKPLEDDPDLDPPDYTGGARLEYSAGAAWSVGASYQAADTDDQWTHLGGLHAQLQHERGELLGEFLYQDGDGLDSSQWGAYLQGVFAFHPPFYLVGRYEHFEPVSGEGEPALNLFTAGWVYKPFPFMALKIEYRFCDKEPEDDPEGLFASFTTFF